MDNHIWQIFQILAFLLVIPLIGCSDKNGELQSQSKAETVEIKRDTIKDEKDSLLNKILSANECYKACSITERFKNGDSTLFPHRDAKYYEGEDKNLLDFFKKHDTSNVLSYVKVCNDNCNSFEHLIPIKACTRACLAAEDEFILRSNYVMDSVIFSRFILEMCDEKCPCTSAFDSVSYKKDFGLVLDSLLKNDILDSVVYAKSNKAIRRLNKCNGTKFVKTCRNEFDEFNKNRLNALKACGLQ